MQVTVIMPTYNHERYVREAIESVFSQQVELELLIMDDGSTDGTRHAVWSALSAHPGRARFFAQERHRGACAVINDLLSRARGEYVALLNSDDRFCPHKLARQLAWMKAHPKVAACFTGVRLIGENGGPYTGARPPFCGFTTHNRSRTQWLKTFFYEGNCLCHPSILARRERYTERFDERLCKLPDYDRWVRLCKREEIFVLPDQLLEFRVREGEKNASAKTPQTVSLIAQELPVVLDRFLDLTEEDALAVFGETGSEVERKFIAYREGLKLSPAGQQWGIRGLYGLLGDPAAAACLAQRGFDGCALAALAAQCDPFGLLNVTARLYYADDRDRRRHALPFAEARSVPVGALEGGFCCVFPLLRKVAALRFDPAERPCRVRLTAARLRFPSGRTADILPLLRHNGRAEGEWVRFPHDDPSFTAVLPAQCRPESAEFEGELEF